MKNIIIAGSGRNGKTTLARKIGEELGYFVIYLDKLMTTFDRAYPQLDIRIAWDHEKAKANVAPFLGHYLGMLSSRHGYADDINLKKHTEKENKLVLEGSHFDFDKISSILKLYGINEMKNNFILIGLVQNKKTSTEFFNDLRKYDTEDEWTYGFDDARLMKFCEVLVSHNKEMFDYFIKYGFDIYDTSAEREQVFERIINDIKLKL